MQELKPLPEPEIDNWNTASLDELRTEVQNLRRWCGQLFLQVKEWTTRSNDLQQTSEQFIKLQADKDKQLADINDDITLIMESLGLSESVADSNIPDTPDENGVVIYDDTPQPNNNLMGNPYK